MLTYILKVVYVDLKQQLVSSGVMKPHSNRKMIHNVSVAVKAGS